MKKTLCFVLALCLLLLAGCSTGSGIAYKNGPIRQTYIVETEDGNFEFSVSLPSDVYDLSQVSPDDRLEVQAQLTYLGEEETVEIDHGYRLYRFPVLHGPDGDLYPNTENEIPDALWKAELKKNEPLTHDWLPFKLQEIPKGEYVLEMELSFCFVRETIVNYAHTFQIPIEIL